VNAQEADRAPDRRVVLPRPPLKEPPPDEGSFTLRQVDQALGDLYAIQDDLDFMKAQLARLPTPNEVWRAALLGMIAGAIAAVSWSRHSQDLGGEQGLRCRRVICGASNMAAALMPPRQGLGWDPAPRSWRTERVSEARQHLSK
jgi:hypothetical protein